ncbi:hypothetical protein Bca101_007022 [Brassica carinata]
MAVDGALIKAIEQTTVNSILRGAGSENEIEWSDCSVDILERNRQSDRGKEKIEKEEEPFRRRRTAQAGREAIGSGCRKDIEREKKKRKLEMSPVLFETK